MALPDKSKDSAKKVQVEEMFDNISPKYDLLNHLLSANIDKIWRKRVIRMLAKHQPNEILDVATGTADFAIAAAKISNSKITGIDISEGMLEIGRKKISKLELEKRIGLIKADSENLPFQDNQFDAAIAGFGVRNFESLKAGLKEVLRVIKPGGVFYILEFSKPAKAPFKQLYQFYFLKILPFIGGLISKNKNAYTYLPESVNEFPDGHDFLTILADVGFVENRFYLQTFGIATIYKAIKPEIRG